MAEYGVNIKASVQGQANIKKLADQIKKITEGLEAADRAFSNFQSKLKSFDQRKREKQTNDELDRRADIYRNMERMQRQLLANDNSRIKSLRKQADLEEHISTTISAGRMRRSQAALRRQGDPNAYATAIGPQRDLETANRLQLMRQTASQVKAFDAQKKFAVEMGRINERLDRKTHDMKIDMLLQEFKTEEAFQTATFEKMMKRSKELLDENAKALGIKTDAEIQAMKKVDAERKRIARENLMLTGQTSPIGGTANMPGSPAALAAAERSKRLRSASSSALIGGAFPLLFGQGIGASVGGAAGGFGGGMLGGEFGFGLSLIGTQLGSFIDQFATKASDLGAALNPLTADINAITAAAGESNTQFGQLLTAYEEEVGAKEALEFATNRLATVVGIDGVNALDTFNSDMVEAGNEFNKFTSIILAGIADIINKSGFLRGAANLAERSRLLIGAKESVDPKIKLLIKQRQEAQSKVNSFQAEIAPDVVAAQIETVSNIEDQIILLQRANEEKELGLQRDALSEKLSEKQLQSLRGTRAELEARTVILKNNGDLLNKEVFNAEKLLINEKMLAKVAKITKKQAEAKVKLSPEAFQEQLDQAVLQRSNDLLELTNRRASAQDALDQKTERASKAVEKAAESVSRKAKREDERKQRAIDRRVETANTEIERATKAFDRVDSQLDSIINKNKDKVAFEREYAELIRNGSTPAAAKQAVELKKQQLELDRNFEKLKEQLDLSVDVAKAAILEAKARGASGKELDDLNQGLADLLDKIGKLSGKKKDAEGAILEALAPKSDRERLQEYLDNLQGQLNDLNDPVKQIIGLAETLGGAFSESFKGIVSGSMTAREALANLFQRTADHFLDMAAQMIAAQIKMQAVNLFMSFLSPLSGGGAPASKYGSAANLAGPGGNFGLGSGPSFADPKMFLPGGSMGRALGGPVSRNQPYLVGERGPEMFVPGAQGNIVPNNAMGGGASVTVNVDASGSSVEGDGNQAAQLGKAIGIAVQQELIKQKRPGGLLTR